MYLIWSNYHNAWWGRARSGYTTSILAAGRYERDEAFKIAQQRDRDTEHPFPEIPIREDDALDLVKFPATI